MMKTTAQAQSALFTAGKRGAVFLLFAAFIFAPFGAPAALAAAECSSAANTDIDLGSIASLNKNVEARADLGAACRNDSSLGIGYCLYVRGGPEDQYMYGPGEGDNIIPVILKDDKTGQPLLPRENIMGPIWDWSDKKGAVRLNGALVAQLQLRNLPIGAYRGFTQLAWVSAVSSKDDFISHCLGWNAQGALPSWAGSGNSSSFVEIKFRVEKSCTIGNAGALNFGRQFSLAAPIDQMASFGISCTPNTAYIVSISKGLHFDGSAGHRAMQRVGGEERIWYDLYQNSARSIIWGDISEGKGKRGAAKDNGEKLYQVYGRVPAQAEVPLGSYRDTVFIDFNIVGTE